MRRQRDQSDYRSMRVRTEVADALYAWMGGAILAVQSSRADPWWEGDHPTPSEAIAELVRRATAHRARQARARAIARERRGKGQPSPQQ